MLHISLVICEHIVWVRTEDSAKLHVERTAGRMEGGAIWIG